VVINIRILCIGSALAVGASASAALTFTEVAQWSQFSQTSGAVPSATSNNGFTARIFSNVSGQVGNATVTTPASAVHNLTAGALVSSYSHFGFASMAAVSAQYGSGVYGFNMLTGGFAGASDAVSYAGPVSFDETPYLTNYAAATSAPASAARTFEWSTSYSATGSYTAIQTYFTLTDLTSSSTIFNSQGNHTTFGSAAIAANALTAGHVYRFNLIFGALDQRASTGGFAPTTLTGSTYYQTTGTFTAVPEPMSIVVVGLGALAAVRRRRA